MTVVEGFMLGGAGTFGFGLGFGEHFFDPRRVGRVRFAGRRASRVGKRRLFDHGLVVGGRVVEQRPFVRGERVRAGVSPSVNIDSGSRLGLRFGFGLRFFGEHDFFVGAGAGVVLRLRQER